jgi:hypothetical protein
MPGGAQASWGFNLLDAGRGLEDRLGAKCEGSGDKSDETSPEYPACAERPGILLYR